MTEKEATELLQTALEMYQKMGESTKLWMSESIPAVIHLLYLNGMIVTKSKNND